MDPSGIELPICSVCFHGVPRGMSGRAADVAKMAGLTPTRTSTGQERLCPRQLRAVMMRLVSKFLGVGWSTECCYLP
jgi:hypothetical protein